MVEALEGVRASQTAYQAAIVADAAAEAEVTRQVTIVEALNDGDVTIGSEIVFLPTGGTAPADNVTLATLVAGRWELVSGIDNEDYDGVEGLVTAANADIEATAAEADALTALQADVVEVVELETDTDNLTWADVDGDEATIDAAGEVTFANGAANVQTVVDEQGDLADLQADVAEFVNARELNAELASLVTARQDAEDFLTDEAPDGLDVNLVADLDTNATAEDDVYLFAEEGGATTDIENFGATGVDRIFVGDDFDLVQLTGDWDASANTGDAAALEIFWEQDGNNTVLYIENETFGGNASSAADITQVTLIGVDAADLSLENGFLVSGSAAVA